MDSDNEFCKYQHIHSVFCIRWPENRLFKWYLMDKNMISYLILFESPSVGSEAYQIELIYPT